MMHAPGERCPKPGSLLALDAELYPDVGQVFLYLAAFYIAGGLEDLKSLYPTQGLGRLAQGFFRSLAPTF